MKINIVIRLVIVFVLFSLSISCTDISMESNENKIVEVKNYFELFDIKSGIYDQSKGTLEESNIQNSIVSFCKNDYRDSYNAELKFVKALVMPNDSHHYIFENPIHDDEVVVYVYSLRNKKVIYKYFIPMS